MKGMNIIQLNTLHLNVVLLNGDEMPGEVVVGGGEVVPVPPTEPETPDVPVEPKKFILSASVANGVVSATLNGVVVSLPFTANEGDVIVVSVTPNDGYEFNGWNDGNTDNPRTITMNADVALSAQCVEVVQPPVGNYIQFEDKAVEAICVANWSSDGIGLTEEDAAKVTDIGIIFSGNNEITSFEEFRYFTGVQKIGHKENETYGAFKGCTNLRSIALPDSCYSIGYGAFGDCKSLTSIAYGNVTEIGSRAFRNCTSLGGELSFPYLTTLKGDGAFANCSALANIDIPSAENIGPHTFYECTSLGVVELLVVTGIGNAAFHSCTNLQSVLVRTSTPPTLGSNVFYGSTCPIYVPDASLEAYKGAINWNTYADRIHPLSEIEGSPYIQFADAEVERVLMSKGVSSDGVGITKEDAAAVTTISTWFKGNTTIQSFEEFKYFTGVTQLVAQAFNGCTNLKKIEFSSSLTSLNNDVFSNSGITSVYAEGLITTGSHSFQNCKSLVSANLPNARNISTTSNDYGSFKGCTALREVNIPNAVVIGNLAFNSCPIEGDLRLLQLETLGKDSLNYAKIDAFVAPKLKSCGNTAFYKCTNLHTVVLRDIERINGYRGYETFRDCTNLRYFVVLSNTPPTLNPDVFVGTPINGGTGGIYVLDDSLEAFKTATYWSAFADVIKPYSQLATDNPTLYAEIQQYL